MNAKEQLDTLKSWMRAYKDKAWDAQIDYFDKSWSILQDKAAVLEDRVERFGENAFVLSDAQWALIEKIQSEKNALLPQPVVIKPLLSAVEALAAELAPDYVGDHVRGAAVSDATEYTPISSFAAIAAERILKGEISRFEARAYIEFWRQQHEMDESKRAIYGTWEGGGVRSCSKRFADLQQAIFEATR